MADTIFLEDLDYPIMAKGFLSKHTIDLPFGQFRSILKYVGKQRNVFVGVVDSRGTSQTCPNCRITVKKELKDRIHKCRECKYEVDRDVAAAQKICNRGIDKYPGTPEKQEIVSQVLLSGNFVLDKWRKSALSDGEEMPNSDIGKPRISV